MTSFIFLNVTKGKSKAISIKDHINNIKSKKQIKNNK